MSNCKVIALTNQKGGVGKTTTAVNLGVSLVQQGIKEIQIYPNGESEQPLKSIEFNFPIYRDGQEVRRLLWEKGNTVECVVLMSRIQA